MNNKVGWTNCHIYFFTFGLIILSMSSYPSNKCIKCKANKIINASMITKMVIMHINILSIIISLYTHLIVLKIGLVFTMKIKL